MNSKILIIGLTMGMSISSMAFASEESMAKDFKVMSEKAAVCVVSSDGKSDQCIDFMTTAAKIFNKNPAAYMQWHFYAGDITPKNDSLIKGSVPILNAAFEFISKSPDKSKE